MPYPRPTNREPSALHPLSATLSPLHHTDGSASLQCGNTHIMVAMSAQLLLASRRENGWTGLMMTGVGGGVSSEGNGRDTVANGGMKPLAIPLPSGGGATEREFEHFLCNALASCIMLERYPHCVIQVVVRILQADGSVLGTALNCAVLALMDAGVAMRSLPVACTFVIVEGSNECGQQQQQHEGYQENERSIWIDPTAEEKLAEGHSIAVLVSSSSADLVASIERPSQELLITSFTYSAPMSMQGLFQCMESVGQCNAATVAFMRMAMEQKVQQEVVTLWS
ncbi:hypothetical protein ACHAW6_000251 [Cyclotella cf. meneghiniana]